MFYRMVAVFMSVTMLLLLLGVPSQEKKEITCIKKQGVFFVRMTDQIFLGLIVLLLLMIM